MSVHIHMDHRSDDSDARLLAATRTEPEAYAIFYRRYERLVLGALMRATGNAETAADLCAEAFAAALVGSSRYRPQGPTAVAWLMTIVYNTLNASYRRGRVEARARRALGISDGITLDTDQLERIEALASLDGQVLALLEDLPPEQRDAIQARVLEERPYREIAGALELSELAVRKRVSRGLLTLRRRMKEPT